MAFGLYIFILSVERQHKNEVTSRCFSVPFSPFEDLRVPSKVEGPFESLRAPSIVEGLKVSDRRANKESKWP
jgi:hypothetical protein